MSCEQDMSLVHKICSQDTPTRHLHHKILPRQETLNLNRHRQETEKHQNRHLICWQDTLFSVLSTCLVDIGTVSCDTCVLSACLVILGKCVLYNVCLVNMSCRFGEVCLVTRVSCENVFWCLVHMYCDNQFYVLYDYIVNIEGMSCTHVLWTLITCITM